MKTHRVERLVPLLLGGSRTKQEAMVEAGYSESYARAGQIQHTEGYKEIMEPIVKQLADERQRIIDELKVKDLSNEKHKDLVDSLAKINKDIQLLSGGNTENVRYEIVEGNE